MPEMINSFAFVDAENGDSFEFEGPFVFRREAGKAEIEIPTNPDDYAGIHESTAENYTDRVGDIGVAIQDGSIEVSGEIETADLLEDRLMIRVDDPARLSPSEATEQLRGGEERVE